MARGMASRLTLSMVPAEEKCLFGRDGLTGATCMEIKPHSPDQNHVRRVPELQAPCWMEPAPCAAPPKDGFEQRGLAGTVRRARLWELKGDTDDLFCQ